jgi:hypothetical protein
MILTRTGLGRHLNQLAGMILSLIGEGEVSGRPDYLYLKMILS